MSFYSTSLLYSACGREHAFLEGLYSLYVVAVYFERLFLACRAGILVRYGEPEPWKAIALKHGRTKRHRGNAPEALKHKKNDGRPPDTVKDLLTKPKKNRPQKMASKQASETAGELVELPREPSHYPWNKNSCWLDTSLQLLYVCLSTILPSVNVIMDGLSKNSAMKVMLEHLKYRHHIDMSDPAGASSLESDRNKICTLLKRKKVISSVTGYEPLLSWFIQLLQLEDTPETYRSIAAFEVQTIEVHTCSGRQKTQAPHIQISRHPHRSRTHQLTHSDHVAFEGDVSAYFRSLLALDRDPISFKSCWRVKDGNVLCSGDHTSTGKLVLSMPILYTFDFELNDGEHPFTWSLPSTLPLLTDLDGDANGLVYDLMGLALISSTFSHFIARYSSEDGSKVLTYDDMSDHHAPREELGASTMTHISGDNIQVPDGFAVYQTFYRLRGGLEAQDSFYQSRCHYISKNFDLNISSPSLSSIPILKYHHEDFIPVAAKDRTWMFNPFKSSTIEYISRVFKLDSASDATVASLEDEPNVAESEEEVEYQMYDDFIPLQSLPGSEVSLPLSLFDLDCRCGIVGDGNLFYEPGIHGEAIQCDECRCWSHIACQRNGRASALSPKDRFICDSCDMMHILPGRRASERRKIEARNGYKKPVKARLKAGCGALARIKEYYYPVRLIQKVDEGWIARWRRGNEFISASCNPTSDTSMVTSNDLRDSLWRDRLGRRSIRLGKWQHGCDFESSEDILSDPSRIPYTTFTHDVLSPHKVTLLQLTLQQFDKVDDSVIPSKRWMDAARKSPRHDLVPYVGHLSIVERAQIANWFDQHITAGDPKLRLSWLGLLPLAHALMGFSRELASKSQSDIMDHAWDVQISGMPTKSVDTDVDRECLYRLEEDMFEVSARAEMAGYYQWGLDSGHHQGNWDPYANLPESWNIGDHMFEEDLLETGPSYIQYKAPNKEENTGDSKKPRPRRMARSKKC